MSLRNFVRNQKFAAGSIIIPWVSMVIFTVSGSLLLLDYVHVLTGAIWTGTDVFLGLILSRVIKTLDSETKYDVSQRILPMTLYFIPSVSILTPLAGLILEIRENAFNGFSPTFVILLFLIAIVIILISFLLILPTSLKIYRLNPSKEINEETYVRVSLLMKRLTLSGALQLLFQVIIIGFMAVLVVH
ncbi:MAG: hypothetical protein ACYCSO_00795 [Cuniculiplasma sp.]